MDTQHLIFKRVVYLSIIFIPASNTALPYHFLQVLPSFKIIYIYVYTDINMYIYVCISTTMLHTLNSKSHFIYILLLIDKEPIYYKAFLQVYD